MNLVWALSISPSQVDLDLIKGEQQCKMIRLSNDEAVNVQGTDKWTGDMGSKGKLSRYDKVASDFNIDLSYESYIEGVESREVEVCITGNQIGEYFGALVYQAEASGGTSAGVGTWLMITIIEEQTIDNNNGGGGGGSGSSGGTGIANTTLVKQQATNNNETASIETENNEINESQQPESNSEITGAVVGINSTRNITIIIISIAVLVIASFLIYKKRKWGR